MAFARLQPERFAFGKDNAGTTAAMSRASEARELDNIMMRYDMVYVRLEWGEMEGVGDISVSTEFVYVSVLYCSRGRLHKRFYCHED